MSDSIASQNYLSAIARSLAFLCLHTAEGKTRQTVLAKADFLMTLGLNVEDAAALVGSSVASIRELQRVSKKKDPKDGKKSQQ